MQKSVNRKRAANGEGATTGPAKGRARAFDNSGA